MTEPTTLIVKICLPDGEVLKTMQITDNPEPWGELIGLHVFVDRGYRPASLAVAETVRTHHNCADDA